MKRTSTFAQEAFQKELAGRWPLAKGSLSRVRQRCQRAGCSVCRQGGAHWAWRYTFRQGGRDGCLYVPEALAPVLREAIANGRWLEQRLVQAGVELIEAYRRERQEET